MRNADNRVIIHLDLDSVSICSDVIDVFSLNDMREVRNTVKRWGFVLATIGAFVYHLLLADNTFKPF